MMTDEFKGARAYLTIPVGISRDKDLLKKPKTILLMGEILTMLNTTGRFYMSNKAIAKRLDVTKRTVADYLNLLADKKLIARQSVTDSATGAIIRRDITAGTALVKYASLGWRNTLPYPSEIDDTGVVKSTSQKEYQYNKSSNKSNKKQSDRRSLTVEQLNSEFESLWARYPNKKGKKKAFNHYKAWRKAKKANTYLYISNKLNDYLKYIREKPVDPQYIMNGSTWFNGRFDDDLKVDHIGSDPNDENSFENLMSDPGEPNSDDLPF